MERASEHVKVDFWGEYGSVINKRLVFATNIQQIFRKKSYTL